MKWWDVVPEGSTLIYLDNRGGQAIFLSSDREFLVDLFTDEVVSVNPTLCDVD